MAKDQRCASGFRTHVRSDQYAQPRAVDILDVVHIQNDLLLSFGDQALQFRAENRKRNAAAQKAWRSADQPAWLNEETYRRRIQPRLSGVTIPVLMSTLDVSKPYATNIRAGRSIPHPRHWLTLARLVGISPDK